jgi:hypothetical protein
MFGVIFLSCSSIVAELKFCFVLGNAHTVALFDVRAKSFVCSTTDVADYISSVVVSNLAFGWGGIVSPTLEIVKVTPLARLPGINLGWN